MTTAAPSSADPGPASAAFFWRLTLAVISVVFGGLLLWSVAAPIESAVVAPGRVVVEGNRRAVQHLEGGVVEEILVREGAKVDAGEVLVRMRNTMQVALLAQIDGQLGDLYARRSRLLAERDRTAIAPPRDGVGAIIGSQDFRDDLEGQLALLSARRQARDTEIALLGQKIEQQRQRIIGLRAETRAVSAQEAIAGAEVVEMRKLMAENAASRREVGDAERELTRLRGQRGSLDADVAEAESIIAEARLQMTRVDETTRQTAIEELRDVELQIAQLEERRPAAADALDRTIIRAPQSGRVLGLAIHTSGAVAPPGAALMEIVPEGDRLQIMARVRPADVDRVSAGQTTRVHFTAFGGGRAPEASGVVRTVSADVLEDATGVAYYVAMIDLPQGDALSAALGGQQLVPGMPVDAYIKTGSRSVFSYLVRPLTEAASRSLREP